MSVTLHQKYAFCFPCMKCCFFFLSITMHYSFYASSHRTVPKDHMGNAFTSYLWCSRHISRGCKYHAATLKLCETLNHSTSISFPSAFFLFSLYLTVCSTLHVSSFFFLSSSMFIYILLPLLEKTVFSLRYI